MSALDTGMRWIWRNGTFVRWEEANVHVMSHVVHYGSSVFEGMRSYETPRGPAIFRLRDHLKRLVDSARIYRMSVPYTLDELAAGCRELLRRNDLREGYLRPLVVRGLGALGLNPVTSAIETFLICWPWGRYLGAEALDHGVDVRVSSWFRPAPNTFPALAKAGGHYLNSQLVKLEAVADGYDEGIAVGPSGLVSEGSGQNVFLVRNGVVHTPALDGTLLGGITRDTVLRICRDLGIEAIEGSVPREMLYTADEVFFAGTATEITPVRSVDRIPVGDGHPGPVTKRLQRVYLNLVHGHGDDPWGWMDPVPWPASAEAR